ncbi:MAG TPA: hypothetical protein VNA23_06580 [Anaerolineales bacterium]|nr:hypothetical protein [Anaerolineales bacterium]
MNNKSGLSHSIDKSAYKHSCCCGERESKNCSNDQSDWCKDADPKKGKANRVFLPNVATFIHAFEHRGSG